jgi:hypothetical protein
VAQLKPRALRSFYAVSYDSQGYYEGILTRLHMGKGGNYEHYRILGDGAVQKKGSTSSIFAVEKRCHDGDYEDRSFRDQIFCMHFLALLHASLKWVSTGAVNVSPNLWSSFPVSDILCFQQGLVFFPGDGYKVFSRNVGTVLSPSPLRSGLRHTSCREPYRR